MVFFRRKKKKKSASDAVVADQEAIAVDDSQGGNGASIVEEELFVDEPAAGAASEAGVGLQEPEQAYSEEFAGDEEFDDGVWPESELLGRLRQALGRGLLGALTDLLGGRKEIDDDLLDELEELLISSDLGVGTTLDIIDSVRDKVSRKELDDPGAIRDLIRDHLITTLKEVEQPLTLTAEAGPVVLLVIGVNGSGKTTTIGKLAHRLRDQGRSVVIAAADTYRAAAVQQLSVWAERADSPLVEKGTGADPAAVVFDALRYAREENCDVVIVDTAGRLHTEVNLMEELSKIRRIADREIPGAPHETLLVLDGTTGQNAVAQAELFNRYTSISGLVLTKLDGTAKGGIVVGISSKLGLPVKLIGIGEQLGDLRDFEPEPFVDALLGNE